MKSATIEGIPIPGELLGLYQLIQGELDEVEVMLRDVPRSNAPFVDRLVQHSFRLGGKRLRPALLLLSGMACGGLKPGHRVLAAVVEMIHTATLIHDDVLDEATLAATPKPSTPAGTTRPACSWATISSPGRCG